MLLHALFVMSTEKPALSKVEWVNRPYLHHCSTQSFTVLYQSCEFCGFSTQ